MCSVHLMYSKSSSNDFFFGNSVTMYMYKYVVYMHLKYILFYMNSSNPRLACFFFLGMDSWVEICMKTSSAAGIPTIL